MTVDQAAPSTTFQIGQVRITRIIELEVPTNPTFLYKEMVPEAFVPYHSWLQPHFVDDQGQIIMTIQSFVVESEGARIVVDTCIGNDKPRAMPFWNELDLPFLETMEGAGFPADSIDLVLCTHLHVDHVGWNTRLVNGKWVPTFDNARYLFGRDDFEYWSGEGGGNDIEHFADSVTPIVERDLHTLVESDHQLTGEVSLEPTPGHSPGHVSVCIESQGERAVITGDVMHHPIQCAEPDWACSFDSYPDQARRSRREFLARYADQPVLVLGTHFATPTAGKIVSDGDLWRFEASSGNG